MFLKKQNQIVSKIYQNIVNISRSKYFYLDLNLDDSFETRFDLLIFHTFIIFYYYRQSKKQKSQISQDLFDLMFNDFENNLREMGFGDIAVNKKMKNFISACYGRIAQYSKGIQKFEENGDKSLIRAAILNNIYKGSEVYDDFINLFVEYMIKNIELFKMRSEEENLENNFNFSKISQSN